MSANPDRSETPEPSWVKKFVVGLSYGATLPLFDFDARMCALARLFFPDKNVVRQLDIRAESVGALVADVESAVSDPDR